MRGLIIAAPTSGSGKTTVTLGVLGALRRLGTSIRSAKSGPDYIDPAFHAAATGEPCVNLDAWAMTPDRITSMVTGPKPMIIEGAMGLFDGSPPNGRGSTADLAKILGLPVVLVVNAGSMSHSVAPLVQGFAKFDSDVRIAGVILNNVGSERHGAMLRAALKPLGIPVVGSIPRNSALVRPSRHLGLVQAGEMPDLFEFLNLASDVIEAHVDLDALKALMDNANTGGVAGPRPLKKETIAVARDAAFSFVYPHHITDWTAEGTKVNWFSPLNDEPVPEGVDAVFLPGGYPELHAEVLAQNTTFMQSLRSAAQDIDIYGECGGYMTLGETLIDAEGVPHKMAGLLGLTTSFAKRKLHLGYRHLTGLSPSFPDVYKGHEFHYATTIAADGAPLFEATDAEGTPLAPMGLVEGNVAGSFAHIIETVDDKM